MQKEYRVTRVQERGGNTRHSALDTFDDMGSTSHRSCLQNEWEAKEEDLEDRDCDGGRWLCGGSLGVLFLAPG